MWKYNNNRDALKTWKSPKLDGIEDIFRIALRFRDTLQARWMAGYVILEGPLLSNTEKSSTLRIDI